MNDEPPGGFWVDAATVNRMVSQGDSWAYSNFDGFPAESDGADWSAFKTQVEATVPGEQEAELLARVEQPDPQPVLMEFRAMFDQGFLWLVLLAGISLLSYALINRFRPKSTGASALLLALAMIHTATAIEAGPRRRAARWEAYQHSIAAQSAPVRSDPEWICTPQGCVPAKLKQKTETKSVINPAEQPKVNVVPPMDVKAWTAFPMSDPGKHLRTYQDCYENETDFVLVIGSHVEAERLLESQAKPVAYESAHHEIKPGIYHVFGEHAALHIEPLPLTKAVTSQAVVPVEWSAFRGS